MSASDWEFEGPDLRWPLGVKDDTIFRPYFPDTVVQAECEPLTPEQARAALKLGLFVLKNSSICGGYYTVIYAPCGPYNLRQLSTPDSYAFSEALFNHVKPGEKEKHMRALKTLEEQRRGR